MGRHFFGNYIFKFCGHARGCGSILRAQARIDDERRVATDDDGDVGKPMIAQTWSEILVVFSLTIGWLICASALVAASAASVRSVESDFMASLSVLILRSFAICSDPPQRPCSLHCMPDTAADRELPPYCEPRRPQMGSASY